MYGTHMYKLYHKQIMHIKKPLTLKRYKKNGKSLNYRKESQIYLMKN